MTGGSATHAGIAFQDKVAAFLGVHILADTPVAFLELPANVSPISIELETSAPVDDILVPTSGGGLCFVNVKKGVTLSRKPESPLGSVIDQFVRLWVACHSGRSGASWQRQLSTDRDRLVLVTGGARSAKFVGAAVKVIGRVADRRSISLRESVAVTESERQAYDALLELLRASSLRHTGNQFSDEILSTLLSMTRVVLLDPDGASKANTIALLRTAVVADPTDAEEAWSKLVVECQRLSETRSGADRAGLRNALRSRGLRLVGPPEIAGDLHRLEDVTKETLSSLAHLARLDLPTEPGTTRIEIHRDVTAALVQHAPQTSLLVIGEPGSGKSGALFSAATRLVAQGHPVLVLAVDQHPVRSLNELGEALRLDRPLVEVLRSWTSDKQGVLFIDALDASRGGPSDRVFREMIRRVRDDAPNWCVVASIRVFDLKFGASYRDMFGGPPVDERYRSPEFGHVTHLWIPQLTDQELEQVWSSSQLMTEAYRQGTATLRDLLRSPFNLFLLASVLAAGLRDVRDITTQLQLLHHYWSYRVIGDDRRALSREGALRRALALMLDKRALQAPVRDVAEGSGEDVEHLLSQGVLAPAEGAGDRVTRISFAHHVLFDYGIARLILEGGRALDFTARLTSSDERALLIAPSAMMALQMLWLDDSRQRRTFWNKAFEIAQSDGTGAFCRMLPARTAAALTDDAEDLQPVLDCLRLLNCPDRAAAIFLVRHCTGALAAGVAPTPTPVSVLGAWPRIAYALAEASPKDVGWMLKPLIGQWVEAPAVLTLDDQTAIGATARLLLQHGSGEPYDASMVIVGIQGVARTFGSAPTESAASLSRLVSRDHVIAHGHEELSWIAREFEHLLAHIPTGDSVVRDVYSAGFCTPLPSRDEATYIGRSRILSLTSNRRQDFEHAQWELVERFPRFFDSSPQSATDTLIQILDCYAATELKIGEEEVVTLAFGDRSIRYQADHSYAWLRHNEHKAPPVHALTSGLIRLIDSGHTDDLTQVLDVVISKNRLASVWASVLRAGAARPHVLGRRLLPLLTAPAVLEGRDTRKPAGDLIAALHPLLSETERVAVEEAILSTDSYAQPVLLGCLDEQSVISEAARHRRRELARDRPLPSNREPLEVTDGWRAQDDDWWLREQGVDLSNEANSELSKAIKTAEGLKRPEGDDGQKSSFLVDHWREVQALHDLLRARPDAPEALLMSGWNVVADVSGTAAELSATVEDLARFPAVAEMIVGALAPTLWPLPIADPDREEAFAKMPSWGSPAPRVEAAGALMALARVQGHLAPAFSELIERLARDASPAVRHQILGRANMLFDVDRPLMWRLCELAFTVEQNQGVLSFFLPAVGRVIRERPEWATERLLLLDEHLGDRPSVEGGRDEFLGHVVQLLLRLWFVHDQAPAGDRIERWTREPVAYAKRIHDTLAALRDTIVQGDPQHPNPVDERVRIRAIRIFESIVLNAGPPFTRLVEQPDLTDTERTTAETALGILDQVASEIYFGSGAYSARNRSQSEDARGARSSDVRARFLQEMMPTLKALAQVPYPSVTHHLLETLEAFIPDNPSEMFRLVTEVLVSGGRTGGYQLESLGSDLFVRIVRRYLADFRALIASDDDLRHRLMKALDVFVEAGWPDARRLVYELPEMLR